MSSVFLLWVITALYAGQSVVSLWYGHYPQVIIFVGYAGANIGLIWSIERLQQ